MRICFHSQSLSIFGLPFSFLSFSLHRFHLFLLFWGGGDIFFNIDIGPSYINMKYPFIPYESKIFNKNIFILVSKGKENFCPQPSYKDFFFFFFAIDFFYQGKFSWHPLPIPRTLSYFAVMIPAK